MTQHPTRSRTEQYQAVASALKAWLVTWSRAGALTPATAGNAADDLVRHLTQAGLQAVPGDADARQANAAAFPAVPGNWLIDVLTPVHDLRTASSLDAERMIETVTRWARAFERGDRS